jgi:hypothetical protein
MNNVSLDKKKLGKKSRAEGKAFEPKVYQDLSEKGWIVNRWNNDIEFDIELCPASLAEYKKGKLIPAKTKWRHTPRGMMPMNLSPGFPDYMVFKRYTINSDGSTSLGWYYDIIGVECKINGKLDKLEKEKCKWYLDNHIFSKILIAEKTKIKNKIEIKYKDFKEKYGKD